MVRITDGLAGLALSTVRRSLSTLSGFYNHLVVLGEVESNPVDRGMAVRSPVVKGKRVVPLVRPVRHLPRVLDPTEVIALIAGLRKHRDRAIVEAMLLAGLRRSEVLGLGMADVRWANRRLFIADGKGGHQRLVPISSRFFTTLRAYLDSERPPDTTTDRVFVVLKGPNRGQPLSAKGLVATITGARNRVGLTHGTCHELRHTCFTRLREAGMSLEALQTQAGHRSMSATQEKICIWLTTGSPASTNVLLRPSTRRAISVKDGHHDDARHPKSNQSITVGWYHHARGGPGWPPAGTTSIRSRYPCAPTPSTLLTSLCDCSPAG